MAGPGRRPRVAIGAILHESSTFAPVLTDLEDFRKNYWAEGPGMIEALRGSLVEMAGAIAALERMGAEPVPTFASHGGCGGVVRRSCYETLKATLLARLAEAGPVDGIYLATHGAMLAEGVFDVEGELLAEIRGMVGPEIPIAVSCDLHGNVTPLMCELAQIIIGYQLYPHDDTFETGERAAALLVRTIRGEIRPVLRMRKAPMMIPGVRQLTAGPYPMADFHRAARAREASGEVLAASYLAAFSKLDAPDTGFRGVVVTDGDPETADRVALDMVREAWRRRGEFEVETVRPEDAIAEGMRSNGRPIVLADTSDCVGGGAAGDSTVVLRALVEAGVTEPTVVLVNDAETVRQAQQAGEGARIQAALGNKITPLYGPPVAGEVTVRRLFDGTFTYEGGIMRGATVSMGPSALVELGPHRVVCCSLSSYEYGDEQFRAAGLDVRDYKFIVAKTVSNFRAAFAHAAAAHILDTPGPSTPNLRSLPWQNLWRPIYPLDEAFEPDFEGYGWPMPE